MTVRTYGLQLPVGTGRQLGRVRNFGLEGTTAATPTFGRILDLEMHHPITRKVGRQQNYHAFARHLTYVPISPGPHGSRRGFYEDNPLAPSTRQACFSELLKENI